MTTNLSPTLVSAVRILIFESNRMSAQLLADALRRDRFDIAYCGCSVADALTAAPRAQIALLSAGSGDQLEACKIARQLHLASPAPKVILMIEEPRPETVVEAFRSGVRGIFSRTTSLRKLKKCILTVREGQIWASNADLNHILKALSAPHPIRLVNASGTELLSKREEDVVRCAVEGLTNREIAHELGISENTVKNYLFRIFDKLGISNRVELILYAVSNLVNGNGRMQEPPKPVDEALEMLRFWREAAEGRLLPEYALGQAYRDGRGTPIDKVTAYMWFSIAEATSTKARVDSLSALQSLARELSPEEMADAKRRAAEWLGGAVVARLQTHSSSRGAYAFYADEVLSERDLPDSTAQKRERPG
jgi:two-component system, NarL family, nitrate/nitrite response regulator NarL